MATDGVGVTTLVAFHGCPLRCRYCLNPQCLNGDGVWRTMTPGELYGEVEMDDLYFVATGGGICFGGGEPLLQTEFIRSFSDIMNPAWKLTLETSLNVPVASVQAVAPLASEWIVDIKDMDASVYRAYTGSSNLFVCRNLEWLASQNLQEKVLVRLPLIPSFNTEENRAASEMELRKMGFTRFERFKYRRLYLK